MGTLSWAFLRNQGFAQLGKDKNDNLEPFLSYDMGNLIKAYKISLNYVLSKLIIILRALIVAF